MFLEDIEYEINKLYKYCLKLTGSPWTAEDLVQETLQVKRSTLHSVFHVIDPDGNILEIVS